MLISYRETQRQEECVTAFNKLFSMAPELLEVIKVFYLEAAEKPKQWDALVALVRCPFLRVF